MTASRTSPARLFAPGVPGAGVSARAPGRHDPLPPVDARLVEPETHTQMEDGVRVETMGANEPHATRHFAAAHVFAGTLAAGYAGAVDMLTRVDATNDLAPDVSIFPEGRDPETGGRKLEEVVFEVCDREDTAHVTRKARRFVARGVRRVFYVSVSRRLVHEWDADGDMWRLLPGKAEIVDPCFAVAIPVAALIDRVLADDTVARALLERRNPVIVKALERQRQAGVKEGRRDGVREGRREGELAATRQALRALLAARGLVCTADADARITACDDPKLLQEWIVRAVTSPSVAAIFATDA